MNTSAIIRDNVEEEAGHERVVDKEDEGHSRIPFAFALLVTVGLLVMNLFLPDDFDALNYFVFFRASLRSRKRSICRKKSTTIPRSRRERRDRPAAPKCRTMPWPHRPCSTLREEAILTTRGGRSYILRKRIDSDSAV